MPHTGSLIGVAIISPFAGIIQLYKKPGKRKSAHDDMSDIAYALFCSTLSVYFSGSRSNMALHIWEQK
jgi:hypothetical protein